MSRSISIPEPRQRLAPVVIVIIYLAVFYSLIGAAVSTSVWYAERPAYFAVVSAFTAAAIDMGRRIAVYARRCSAVRA